MRDRAPILPRVLSRAAALAWAIALLMLDSSGCASPGQRDPLPVAEFDPADTASIAPARWPGFPLLPDGRFPIAGWCAPPVAQTTDARYAEYARAGFTVVLPALEDPYLPAPNLARLEVAGRRGLYVIVRDERLYPGVAQRPGWRAATDTIVATYSAHPALLGYFLADEPGPDFFGPLAAVTRRLAMRDPRHPAHINLYGEGPVGHEIQGLSYSAYLRRFMESVRPGFFSLSNYVLKQDGTDIPTFCSGWDSARTAAGEVPFWAILLVIPHGPYREPTEAELAWQANLALAHGARGIVWFTYWSPNPAEPLRYRGGPIAYDGSRNPSYDSVARVNAWIGALGRELAPLRCADVRHTGELPRGGGRLDPDPAAGSTFGLAQRGEGNLTFGLFLASDGRRHVLVVNRDYRNPTQARIVSEAGWERWTGEPSRYKTSDTASDPLMIRLEPGGAALLRAAGSGPKSTPR